MFARDLLCGQKVNKITSFSTLPFLMILHCFLLNHENTLCNHSPRNRVDEGRARAQRARYCSYQSYQKLDEVEYGTWYSKGKLCKITIFKNFGFHVK